MSLFDNLQTQAQANLQPTPQLPSPIMDSPEISNFYSTQRQLTGSTPAVGALINESSQQVGRDEASRAAEIARLKDEAEGNGYQRTSNATGGYNFFDSKGTPISAFQYARAKGVGLTDALQGSADAGDQKVVSDYNGIKELAMLVSMSSKERQQVVDTDEEGNDITYEDQLNQYYKENPQVKGLTPQQVLNKFMNSYSHMFRMK
jgi:hypothetical protein